MWSQGLGRSLVLTFKACSSVLPCDRKLASPVGSVCYRRSNRPLGNLLVPTVYGRDLYQDQSGIQPRLTEADPPDLVLFLHVAAQSFI